MNDKDPLILTSIVFLCMVVMIWYLPKMYSYETVLNLQNFWRCEDGAWVKHGNPSVPVPVRGCGVAAKPSAGIPNPASANCAAKGGALKIEKGFGGGEFGVCYFEDNRQCEEWALLRGDCPVGGRKVAGYVTEPGRYCAIRGGAYVVEKAQTDAAAEKGTCALPDKTVCDADAHYEGKCPKN